MILRHRKKALLAPLVLVAVGLAIAAGCGDDDSASGETAGGGGGDSTLTLVGYTTPREVYEQVIPDFQATPAGEGVDFEQSYGPSGDQSRAVEAGLDADVLALSLAPDIDRLVEPGIVDANWASGPTKGFVSNSIVVFAVRKGNPKNIQTWDDLVKDDVEVITPNPFTSGGAQWNIGAAYGAQLAQGKSKQEALEYLQQLFENVPVQPKGARESLQVFTAGKGDVLLAYENEAITAQQAGEDVDYVIPDQTILIQNPHRRDGDERQPDGRQGLRGLRAQPAGAGGLRGQGLSLGQPGGREGERVHLPRPARALRDRRDRRLEGVQGRVLRAGHGHHGRHLRGQGVQPGR